MQQLPKAHTILDQALKDIKIRGKIYIRRYFTTAASIYDHTEFYHITMLDFMPNIFIKIYGLQPLDLFQYKNNGTIQKQDDIIMQQLLYASFSFQVNSWLCSGFTADTELGSNSWTDSESQRLYLAWSCSKQAHFLLYYCSGPSQIWDSKPGCGVCNIICLQHHLIFKI